MRRCWRYWERLGSQKVEEKHLRVTAGAREEHEALSEALGVFWEQTGGAGGS